MMIAFQFWQRIFGVLCLCSLTACSYFFAVPCRQWTSIDTLTDHSCFNSGRLYLAPENDYSHLELEIDRSTSGVRMYVNVLFLCAPPCPDDTSRAIIEVYFEGEKEPKFIYCHRLKGGQRLLLTNEDADMLIEALLAERSFAIKIGHYQFKAVPDGFAILYDNLLSLPIAENEPGDCN